MIRNCHPRLGNANWIENKLITPRPQHHPRLHLIVRLRQQELQALLDTGAEIFCISPYVLQRDFLTGPPPVKDTIEVHLTNNSLSNSPGSMTLTIHIDSQKLRNLFFMLPQMKTAMIIGVDLWGRIGFPLTSLLLLTSGVRLTVCPTVPRLAKHFQIEEDRLHEFLRTKLVAFEQIRGSTHRSSIPSGLPILDLK